jgi:acyl-coenzyme A synthetase/AMP-(fatty) acid ligase/acyl carrier protein
MTVPSLYLPLMNGDCVDLLRSGDELAHLAQRITEDNGGYLLRMTPMHVNSLLQLLPASCVIQSPHMFVIGGDYFQADVARSIHCFMPNAQVYSQYGQTEASVGCCLYDVTANLDNLPGVMSAGKPMDNTLLYVLNEQMQMVPIGVTGELYVGGDGLANGYLNRPDLNREKFVANPFDPELSERIYRSGDLVRWQDDGNLEFIARVDDQVKIRGFRVELGDIEYQINQLDSVKESVVLTQGEGIDKKLIAYVVPGEQYSYVLQQQEQSEYIAGIIDNLKTSLADYMVPVHFIVMDKFLLTANNKLDKKNLPAPNFVSRTDYLAPKTGTEEKMCYIFASVLGLDQVGADSNFFDLGGHSLSATKLVSEVRSVFAVEMRLRSVFENQSVAAIAQEIDALLVIKGNNKDDADHNVVMEW